MDKGRIIRVKNPVKHRMARQAKNKVKIEGAIPVVVLKEGDMFIAHSPVLDLSSCGETFQEASQNFEEALQIFFEECIDHGTLEAALESCGWSVKTKHHIRRVSPPIYLGEHRVCIPQLA